MKARIPQIGFTDPWKVIREKTRAESIVVGFAILYILLQFYFVTLDDYVDFYTHAKWGIQFYEGSIWPASDRTPYKDYSANEYPVVSVYGWIIAYGLCPHPDDYFWLSVFMLFPYWVLAAIGGTLLLPLLRERGFNDRHALYIIAFYFFNPQNIVDTARNHGSLGTFATIVIAYYFWTKERDTSSAAFIALGFGIKIYPIFIAPFLFVDARNLRRQLRFLTSLVLFLFLIHLPVLLFFSDYLEVLRAGELRRGGMSLADGISDFGTIIGIENSQDLVFLIYLIGMSAVVCGLLPLVRLDGLDKFTLVYGVNCLLESYSGIGHYLFVMILLIIALFSPNLNISSWQYAVFIGYLTMGTLFGLPLLGPFKWWPKYCIVALTVFFLPFTFYILWKNDANIPKTLPSFQNSDASTY